MLQGPPFSDPRGLQGAALRILQIVPDLDAGGAERTSIDIAEALAEAGCTALVASEGGRMVSELQAKGGIWIRFPARAKNPWSMALNMRRLARLIRAERIDIVHARSRAPAWVAYGATRLTKTPFVTTYHGSYSGTGILKLRYNSVMAKGDLVIANSLYTGALIARLYPGTAGKVRVIPRGIDLRAFAPGAVESARVERLRQAWGVAADERIVLLAARLSPWKGHKVLVEAARLLGEAGLTDTKFIFAGDSQGRGHLVKEIDEAIGKAGLTNVIRRVGYCADMPAALLAASVVIVPSTQPEAFGRVAVEAQAMGTPVIVSNLGALPENVVAPPQCEAAQRTGWIVPAGNAQELAAAITAAFGLGASARDALSMRARTHAESRFSVARMSAETLAAYAALIAGPPDG